MFLSHAASGRLVSPHTYQRAFRAAWPHNPHSIQRCQQASLLHRARHLTSRLPARTPHAAPWRMWWARRPPMTISVQQVRWGLVGGGVSAAMSAQCWSAFTTVAHCDAVAVATPPPIPSSISEVQTSLMDRIHEAWRWIVKTLRAGRKLVFIYLGFVPPVVAAGVLDMMRPSLSPSMFERLAKAWGIWFRFACEVGGVTYLKLGQWASMRRDWFSGWACDEMQGLTDHASPHSWRETERLLEEELGVGWKDFLHIDPTEDALGVGSVGQVYRGWYTENPSDDPIEVAVKVLHPGAAAAVEDDINLLRGVAWLAERIPAFRYADLPNAVEQAHQLLTRQVDLRHEAKNLGRFRENFASDKRVSFPRAYTKVSTSQVLVEDYSAGIPIGRVIRDGPPHIKKYLGSTICDVMMKMLFRHNLSHGDMHQGNVLVTGLNAGDLTPDDAHGRVGVTLIDAGITSELGDNDWHNFMDLFSAIANRDGERAGKLLIERSDSKHCTDPDKFVQGISALVDNAMSTGLALSKLRVGVLLSQVLSLSCAHGVRLEANFLNVAVTIMVVEAMGRSLEPELNILDAALPYLVTKKVQTELGATKGFFARFFS
eukprot:m.18490 g.18490  ORF g.18490 m.18490 type:complete len:599 (+) comp3598_c0_seq1:17-1813(+)